MSKWIEYRIIRSRDARRNDPLRANYVVIRQSLLDILSRYPVEHSVILNYFEAGRRDYIRVRIEASPEVHRAISSDLESLKGTPEVWGIEKEDWSAAKDAKDRISSVSANLRTGGVSDVWGLPGTTVSVPRDLGLWLGAGMWSQRTEDELAKDLADLIVMAGDWSREFIERFEKRPDEGFLLSLMVHLLLNGLAFSGPNQGEEAVIRFTPLVP